MANVFRGIGSRRFLTSDFALDIFLGEKVSTLDKICRIFKKEKMKKIIKIIAFQIGVDVLGFPNFHKHLLVFKGYITTIHETYHKSIKHLK